MFEKIKEKAKEGKQWVVDHKTEIAVVIGYCVGAVVTTGVFMYQDDAKRKSNAIKYAPENKVLSMRKYANGLSTGYGLSGPKLSDLSTDLISGGAPANAKVIGAIVYTKSE